MEALHPDVLVAFLDEVDQALARTKTSLAELVNRAGERNLTTGELAAPVDDEPDSAEDREQASRARQLHSYAYALTGSSAKARRAVSQLDDEHVAQAANALARDVAEREKPSA